MAGYYDQQAKWVAQATPIDEDDDTESSVAESSAETDDSQSGMTAIKCFINAITASAIDSMHEDALDEKPHTKQWNMFVLRTFESDFNDLPERKIWHRYLHLLHTEEPTIEDWMVDKICSGFKQFESETLNNVLVNQPDWWDEREWSDSESSDEEDSDEKTDEEDEMKSDTDDQSDDMSQDSQY